MDVDYSPKDFSPFPDRQKQEAERKEIRDETAKHFDLLEELRSHYDEAEKAILSRETTPMEITLRPIAHAIHARSEKRLLSFIRNERSYLEELIRSK